MFNKKLSKEIIIYLAVGVFTTLLYFICYFIFEKFLTPTVSTVIAWFMSAMSAYITNSKFVFNSGAKTLAGHFRQIISFFAARLFSGVFDVAATFVFIEKLGCNDLIIKIIINVFVVVFNYVVSKLFIFKRKK